MIPRDEYLTNEVLTATPQRLHLMLIEAAIRHCERARQLWTASLEEPATLALTKAQEIVSELMASLNYGQQPELAARMASVYQFIFRQIVHAGLMRNERSLADALRILEIERDTWREIVRLVAGTHEGPPRSSSDTRTHAGHGTPAPVALPEAPVAGFSIHA